MSHLLNAILKHGKELDKAELREGEKHCDVCDGVGILKDENDKAKFCDNCKGTGKLDWVEEIVGKQSSENHSALDNVNVRHMVNYVQKELDNTVKDLIFEQNDKQTMDVIKNTMEGVLFDLKSKRGLYDYQINSGGYLKEGEMEILLKPNATVEYIKLDVKVT